MLKSKLLLTVCAVAALSFSAQADTEPKVAKADMINTKGEVIGEVTAIEAVRGTIINLKASDIPEGWHGLHLHKVGDCSDYENGFKLSGGHVNLRGHKHGLLNEDGYEEGDFPNVYAHKDGLVLAQMYSSVFIMGSFLNKNGMALVMHEGPDDMVSQPIGGAGARIACAAFKGTN